MQLILQKYIINSMSNPQQLHYINIKQIFHQPVDWAHKLQKTSQHTVGELDISPVHWNKPNYSVTSPLPEPITFSRVWQWRSKCHNQIQADNKRTYKFNTEPKAFVLWGDNYTFKGSYKHLIQDLKCKFTITFFWFVYFGWSMVKWAKHPQINFHHRWWLRS